MVGSFENPTVGVRYLTELPFFRQQLSSYRFSVNNFLRPVKFRLILACEGVYLVPLVVLDDKRTPTPTEQTNGFMVVPWESSGEEPLRLPQSV